MLYDPERHEKLNYIDWNEEQVKVVIKDIFEKSLASFDSEHLWPTDSNEDADIACNKTMYYGAAGNLWALDQIALFLDLELPFDKASLIQDIHKKYLVNPDTKEVIPSLFLGETGILLLDYRFSPSDEVEKRLFRIIKENIRNPTLEALWGAPGTMIAASYMYEWTKHENWKSLFLENAKYLIEELRECVSNDERIWTQDIFGKKIQYVGAGHGYFGNMFGILKKIKFLSEKDQAFILDNISKMTNDLATVEDDLVNWFPTLSEESKKYPLAQWCHGSPGVIIALESFPDDVDHNLEKLLIGAGELTWKAGPLKKGIALCHGTDGNGYAFLQLYKRTGDSLWLDRARKFAMHALEQRNGRYTLFTGELGLAIYLISCIEKRASFPFLGSFEICK